MIWTVYWDKWRGKATRSTEDIVGFESPILSFKTSTFPSFVNCLKNQWYSVSKFTEFRFWKSVILPSGLKGLLDWKLVAWGKILQENSENNRLKSVRFTGQLKYLPVSYITKKITRTLVKRVSLFGFQTDHSWKWESGRTVRRLEGRGVDTSG